MQPSPAQVSATMIILSQHCARKRHGCTRTRCGASSPRRSSSLPSSAWQQPSASAPRAAGGCSAGSQAPSRSAAPTAPRRTHASNRAVETPLQGTRTRHHTSASPHRASDQFDLACDSSMDCCHPCAALCASLLTVVCGDGRQAPVARLGIIPCKVTVRGDAEASLVLHPARHHRVGLGVRRRTRCNIHTPSFTPKTRCFDSDNHPRKQASTSGCGQKSRTKHRPDARWRDPSVEPSVIVAQRQVRRAGATRKPRGKDTIALRKTHPSDQWSLYSSQAYFGKWCFLIIMRMVRKRYSFLFFLTSSQRWLVVWFARNAARARSIGASVLLIASASSANARSSCRKQQGFLLSFV